MKPTLVVVLALVITACASTRFDIPSLALPGEGSALPGKIVWHDLLTDTPDETRAFYGGLFGWTFEPLDVPGANYTLIRHQGRLIGGMVDQNRLATPADISQWVVVLSVADAAQATQTLADAGGTVFTPPTSLGERGTISVVADPQGAVLALLQTDGHDPADNGADTPIGGFLWDELWASDPADAAAFYQRLAAFDMEPLAAGPEQAPVAYKVLSSQGVPRLGIRKRPADDLSPTWASYLRVADEDGLKDIVARTEALGGRVLMPVTQRPRGGHVAVIAGPSGAGIALQTWPLPDQLAGTPGGEP
jgi:predicted enzyme related to lactoylglutathione lyase